MQGGDNLSEKMLEMRGITKEFPGVKALDDVNFVVRKGSIHALVGENGAGKSTLMNVLSGWYPYGQTVTFTAEPDTAHKYYLESWTGGDGSNGLLVEGVSAAGLQLVTKSLAPVSIQANFYRDGSGTHYTPPETNTVGMFRRKAASIMPGVILSQLEMHTSASAQCAFAMYSTLSAMRSRLGRE